MPSSRRRKKQVVASRRQLEKTRRKLNQKALLDQENQASGVRDREGPDGGKEDGTSTKSWWDWCASGVTQVRLIIANGCARHNPHIQARLLRILKATLHPRVLAVYGHGTFKVFPSPTLTVLLGFLFFITRVLKWPKMQCSHLEFYDDS